MKISVPGLASIDPLAVPLPHGTEVSTRVDRVLGERRVPQGAVGRVVGESEGAVEVLVVGVGRVRYAREELLPRKSGQLRYARRRAALWEALTPCTVLRTTVGSRAWGLAHEGSDIDTRGVFVLPLPWTAGLGDREQDLASADGSTTIWEIEKAIRQALRADPNTLETLFVPSATALDPIGEWLLEARDAFVSVEIYGSFGRYALSQLKKLSQSARLAEHRALVLDWLRADASATLDAIAARLAQSTTGLEDSDSLHRAKAYVKQLYGSMFDQGLLPAREFAALVEFARTSAHEFDLPRELRPKNAYNLIRLLHTAINWLESGQPRFAIAESDPLHARLLAIKHGEVPLDDVLRDAEALTPRLEEARNRSPLPRRADLDRADVLLRRVREEVARRHVVGEPGPLGRDAPQAPALAWEDDDATAPDPDVPEAP